MEEKVCGWCLQKLSEEEIDKHLEERHGDYQHKRK